MRARAAYISSFGTSSILIAAALLMLAVASALVAFNGWPGGGSSGDSVKSVSLAPPADPARRLNQVRSVAASAGVARGGVRDAATRRSAGSAGSVTGLYKDGPTAGTGRVGGMFKAPVAMVPAPTVVSPPPSTGPQQQVATASPPTGERPVPPGASEPGLAVPTLPEVPVDSPLLETPPGVGNPAAPLAETQAELARISATDVLAAQLAEARLALNLR